MTGGSALRVPWRDGDLVAVTGAALVGLIAVLLSWFGASGSPSPAHQMMWLNLAVVGMAIFAICNCLWLMRLRRAVGQRRVGLVSLEVTEVEVGPERAAPAVGSVDRPVVSAGWVRGEGMARVHRPDCPLVAGKHVWPAHVGDGELCGVCADG